MKKILLVTMVLLANLSQANFRLGSPQPTPEITRLDITEAILCIQDTSSFCKSGETNKERIDAASDILLTALELFDLETLETIEKNTGIKQERIFKNQEEQERAKKALQKALTRQKQ